MVLLLIVMAILSAVLLGGIAAIAASPLAVYSSRYQSQLWQRLTWHVQRQAPEGFEKALEPSLTRAWTRMQEVATIQHSVAGNDGSWTEVLAAFYSGMSTEEVREHVDQLAAAHLRDALAQLDRVAYARSHLQVIQDGSRWAWWARLRLAGLGLADHGPATARAATERVGAAVTSFTVVGLLVAIVGVVLASFVKSDVPEVTGALSLGATYGALAGMIIGVRQLYSRTKATLVDTPRAWRQFFVTWVGVTLLAPATVMSVWIVLHWGQLEQTPPAGGAGDGTVSSWHPFAVWALSTIVLTLMTLATCSLFKHTRSWSSRVAVFMFCLLPVTSWLLLSATMAAAPAWATYTLGYALLGVAFGIFVVLLVVMLGEWSIPRVRRKPPYPHLGRLGILVTWGAIFFVGWLLAYFAITLMVYLVTGQEQPDIRLVYWALGSVFALCAWGAWLHWKRNARLVSGGREALLQAGKVLQPRQEWRILHDNHPGLRVFGIRRADGRLQAMPGIVRLTPKSDARVS